MGKRVSFEGVIFCLTAFAVLVCTGLAYADVIEVHPGESIQAAIDLARAGDTVRIFGQEGRVYGLPDPLILKQWITLEGVDNPVLEKRWTYWRVWDLELETGVVLRGLKFGGVWRLEIRNDVQDSMVADCEINGTVRVLGARNVLKGNVVRSNGSLVAVGGSTGDNQLIQNVLHSTGPFMYRYCDQRTCYSPVPISGPVLTLWPASAADPVQRLGNVVMGNTIIAWGKVPGGLEGKDAVSTGIEVYGNGHRIIDTIIHGSGGNDVTVPTSPTSPPSRVDVTYSLLGRGTTDPNVRLGDGVLVGVDPLFVDPGNGDFHLQPGSPAIDAGDPNSPPDPDGSRADMGALAFDQSARVIDVYPGDSIQAALAQAVSGDTVRIHGEPGYVYRTSLPIVMKELLTVEGVNGPVIGLNTSTSVGQLANVRMASGSVLRGVTVVSEGLPGSTLPLAGHIVEFDFDVQHGLIEGCAISGVVDLNGSGNEIRQSRINGLGTVVSIRGGNNYLFDTIVESSGGWFSESLLAGVIRVSSTSQSRAVGGNLFFGNTIAPRWTRFRASSPRRTYQAVGIHFATGAGSNNELRDTIVAKGGGPEILNEGPQVLVRYSLLQRGMAAGDVLLGDGVLLARNPLFRNARQGDYRLRRRSPAIDSGDPASPLDPDGTRADMGALPFDHRTGQ